MTSSPSSPTFTAETKGGDVQCDLCGWPMTLPDACRKRGVVLGLLVCTQCVEDNLAAAIDPRTTLGLVGGGGSRP